MKRAITFMAIVCTLACSAQQTGVVTGKSIVFSGVNVLPMDTERVLENQDVVVSNGKIVSITKAGSAKPAQGAIVVNGKGKYLLPGLAEMHAHVPPVDDLEPMKEVLLLFAVNGVTTIRGMLGHPRHLELRSKVRSGELVGPHFYTSGPSLNGNTVNSSAAASQQVQSQKAAGYDFLKIHPGITQENFTALVQAARAANIGMAGHVPYGVGVWNAIDAGYETIDHLDGFVESLVPGIQNISEKDAGLFGMFIGSKADTAGIPRLMNALRDKGIWVVPTQALAERWFAPQPSAEALAREPEMKYLSPSTISNWTTSKNNLLKNPMYNAASIKQFIQLRRQLILACQRYGVGLLLGSDAPQVFDVPGFSAHQELGYMVDAGLTPYEALRTATVHVAKFLKQDDAGVIKAGAVSDLVLLNANPLQNIKNVQQVEGVMIGDKWLPREFINATLKQLEKK